MAFIASFGSVSSSFLNGGSCTSVSPVKSHVRPNISMSILDNAGNAFKIAIVTGAVVATATALRPSKADAGPLFHFRADRPQNIGLRYGRYLDNCPATPNCVSSMANVYDSHFVPAWTYNADSAQPNKTMAEAIQDVTKVINDFPRTTIISSEPSKSEIGQGHYIYAEFESKLFGFVDDVEFFFQPDNTTVEYRSASRLGENDLKANRTRIRDIRKTLQDMDKRWASVGY